MRITKDRLGGGIIDNIQVKNGVYCIKYFSGGILTEIHFIYGADILSMNRGYDFMNFVHGKPCYEISRDDKLHMNDKALYLRENIGELKTKLKNTKLPEEVRKAINSLKK